MHRFFNTISANEDLLRKPQTLRNIIRHKFIVGLICIPHLSYKFVNLISTFSYPLKRESNVLLYDACKLTYISIL